MNHTLAHALADVRGAPHAVFAVCAPATNEALLGDGVLDRFRARLAKPESFRFIPLGELLDAIERETGLGPEPREWCRGVRQRYGGI